MTMTLKAPSEKKKYKKDEHQGHLGNHRLPGDDRLDFLLSHPVAGWAGIEAKNVREWLYPNRDEIKDLIRKAVALDCVPVLIARRFPFVTFRVLSMCGVVVHQTYNQRFHVYDSDVASLAKRKDLLGYHDIRIGDEPRCSFDEVHFNHLPSVLPQARERFVEFKDLLDAFGKDEMGYQEFAARARRRSAGEDEDADWEDVYDDESDDWDY